MEEPCTKRANFWPEEQWPRYVLVKNVGPAVVRVIFAGLVVRVNIGLVVLHGPYAASVISATSSVPFIKLKTRVSPTYMIYLTAQPG